jgi:hypothetical protein
MKKWLPILIVFLWVGSFISCKQQSVGPDRKAVATSSTTPLSVRKRGGPSNELNPFSRYLADSKADWPESALMNFAKECQVDVESSRAKYAQRPGDKWIPVNDLSNALNDQETDFYGTVAVWHSGERVLAERWGMELDTGDYHHFFVCLDKQKITIVDSISWSIELHNDSSKDSGWGYDHRWKLDPDGNFVTVSKGFIDLHEKPIGAPKMDTETKNGLNEETLIIHAWKDLELPDWLL